MSLSDALFSQFEHTKKLESLDRAIATTEEAVEISRGQSGLLLIKLAQCLNQRYLMTGSAADLDRSAAACENATFSSSIHPINCIVAAWRAAEQLESRKTQRANELLRIAFERLPSVSPCTLHLPDQQFILSGFAGLAGFGAAVSLVCGHVFEALHRLEAGKGIIYSVRLDMRTDVTALKEKHPQLANQIEERRNQLDSLSLSNRFTSPEYVVDSAAKTEELRLASLAFDSMLQNIRGIDGFATFLCDPSQAEMSALAEHGPIVVFNVALRRSDAFLITKERVKSLCLPKLQYRVLQATTVSIQSALNNLIPARYSKATTEMKRLLEWLWEVALIQYWRNWGFGMFQRMGLRGHTYGGFLADGYISFQYMLQGFIRMGRREMLSTTLSHRMRRQLKV